MQVPYRVATRISNSKSLVNLSKVKAPGASELPAQVSALEVDALPLGH